MRVRAVVNLKKLTLPFKPSFYSQSSPKLIKLD